MQGIKCNGEGLSPLDRDGGIRLASHARSNVRSRPRCSIGSASDSLPRTHQSLSAKTESAWLQQQLCEKDDLHAQQDQYR